MGTAFAALACPVAMFVAAGGLRLEPVSAGAALLFSMFYGLPILVLMMIAARLAVGSDTLSPKSVMLFAVYFIALAASALSAFLALNAGSPSAPKDVLGFVAGLLRLIGMPIVVTFWAYLCGLLVRDWWRKRA